MMVPPPLPSKAGMMVPPPLAAAAAAGSTPPPPSSPAARVSPELLAVPFPPSIMSGSSREPEEPGHDSPLSPAPGGGGGGGDPTALSNDDDDDETAAGAEQDWEAAKAAYESLTTTKRPRPPKPQNAITVAVSSRVLFDMVEERKIYEDQGVEKYVEYQQANENVTLKPGPAFSFVKALEQVNARLRELYPEDEELFDIVLMTNNHAQVGVRLINSINHYGLLIERFCMTGGKSPVGYLKAYLTNLYLSADSEKVQEAIEAGIAAATLFTGNKKIPFDDKQLRVAFDGDAVLFSDESEIIVKEHGLDRFFEHEQLNENKPLAQGPLKGFLEDLGRLQKKFYVKNERLDSPIRTYLVTARSAASSGARVLKTLRSWGVQIDEALFLAGAPKGPILAKIRPHIFFDDQMFHIEGARQLGTVAAHVPYGIGQKYHKSKLKEGPASN